MSTDPNTCVHCEATGCLDGTAQHTPTCPFVTGMWPLDQAMLDHETVCAGCEEPFAMGDLYATVTDMTHPAVDGAAAMAESMGAESVAFIVCLGCAAMGREVAR